MKTPEFAAIIRTQGRRNHLLREAVASLRFQRYPCRAVIVVHAGDAEYSEIVAAFPELSAAPHAILHAADADRKRGYPLNVALDHLYDLPDPPDFVFLLDDDDIVYPVFSSTIVSAWRISGADLIYGASNRRDGDSPPVPGFLPKPLVALFYENFIAANSFAVTFESLQRVQARFDEDLDCFEDWKFLLALLEKGLTFEPAFTVVSEFRTGHDPDRQLRGDPLDIRRDASRIRAYIQSTRFSLPGAGLAGGSMDPGPRFGTEGDWRQTLLAEKDGHIAALEARIHELETSLSWKITRPLRIAGSRVIRWLR